LSGGRGVPFEGWGFRDFLRGGRVDADVVLEETEFFQDFLSGGRGVPFEGWGFRDFLRAAVKTARGVRPIWAGTAG